MQHELQQKTKGKKTRGQTIILDRRQYKGRTIVLGKDNFQYMIGVDYGNSITWRKFFSDLPPADRYGGAKGLASSYFYDPDAEEFKDFGPLFIEDYGVGND